MPMSYAQVIDALFGELRGDYSASPTNEGDKLIYRVPFVSNKKLQLVYTAHPPSSLTPFFREIYVVEKGQEGKLSGRPFSVDHDSLFIVRSNLLPKALDGEDYLCESIWVCCNAGGTAVGMFDLDNEGATAFLLTINLIQELKKGAVPSTVNKKIGIGQI